MLSKRRFVFVVVEVIKDIDVVVIVSEFFVVGVFLLLHGVRMPAEQHKWNALSVVGFVVFVVMFISLDIVVFVIFAVVGLVIFLYLVVVVAVVGTGRRVKV